MDPDGGEDRDLIRQLAESAPAFERFYRAHVREVTRFVARRCRTPEDVADAVAATFLAVLTSAHTYDADRGSPSAWLHSIAANEVVRQHRVRQRTTTLGLRLQGRRLLSPDDSERIAEIIDAEQAARQLRRLIAQAPPAERQLLERIVEGDGTTASAARSLGITPGAARVRLARLRQRARRDADVSTDEIKAACRPEGGTS